MALERIQRKAKSNILQTEIDLAAKKAEFKRQSDKLKEDEDQIKATRIYAPSDGLVLYASSVSIKHGRNKEPLAAGSSVYERQAIILLPDTTKMMASIKIHETNIKKLSLGMPAHITVDALPDCDFSGHLEHIAPLPDPSSFWMNPDLKVYNTEVYIDSSTANLRSGMTCEVEIIAETHTNALFVPLQSVIRINGKPKVFTVNKYGETKSVTVQTGSNNGRMIHILSGISQGEQVMLTPPLSNSERKTIPADPSKKNIQTQKKKMKPTEKHRD
jgi:HlyD family secretion protein